LHENHTGFGKKFKKKFAMFSHSPLRCSTAVFVLLTLVSAEVDGQVHRNGDGLLPLPRSPQLPSTLNGSGVAFPPGNGENVPPPKDDGVDIYPESWVSDLFYRALVNFTIQHVGSSACQRQVDMYVRNLQNYSDWAVRSELTLNL